MSVPDMRMGGTPMLRDLAKSMKQSIPCIQAIKAMSWLYIFMV